MTCGRKALTDNVIVLGVDGFEPSLAKKFMDQGKMPNLKKFVERGAARADLTLLGAMPTVTPPMWTANPATPTDFCSILSSSTSKSVITQPTPGLFVAL